MFEYMTGTLTASSPAHVTLETQGIGYRLFIPLNHYAKLPQIGTPVTLYIATVIREDSHKNYGFLSRDQRDLFENLIDVSGIGPKTALALLGHLEIHDLQLALAQGNTVLLSKIPGIGKKTAERLGMEMRDRVKKMGNGLTPSSHPLGGQEGIVADAISALVHLGYNPTRAQKAITAILGRAEEKTPPQLAQLITEALRSL